MNYGYGYGGSGFEGGYWQGGHLFYNRSVVNVGTTNITNVYTKTIVNNITVNRVSYNGGSGGVQARPTATELAAAHAQHLLPTAAQQQHVQAARSNPALHASTNHGNPPIAATPRPGVFSGDGVIAAKHTGAVSEPVEHKSKPVTHKVAVRRWRIRPESRRTPAEGASETSPAFVQGPRPAAIQAIPQSPATFWLERQLWGTPLSGRNVCFWAACCLSATGRALSIVLCSSAGKVRRKERRVARGVQIPPAAFHKPGLQLAPPEPLEPIRRQFGVPHRVSDVLMPQVVLQRSRVMALVGDAEDQHGSHSVDGRPCPR